MEYQTPAEGIMKTHEFQDSFSYRVSCTCGNPDDTCEIFIEKDEASDEFIITFSTTQKTHWWKTLCDWEIHKINNPLLYWIANTTQSLINGLHQRLKITYSVWIKGYVEYQSSTIISKQTALNFAEALKNTVLEIDKNEKVD